MYQLPQIEQIVEELEVLGEKANELHREALKEVKQRQVAAEAKAHADGKEVKRKFKVKAVPAKDLVSTEFPTLTKGTFPCVYRCAFTALLSAFIQNSAKASAVFNDPNASPESIQEAYDTLTACVGHWRKLVVCAGGTIVGRALRIQVRHAQHLLRPPHEIVLFSMLQVDFDRDH
jgi:hypothetical protein